MPRLYAPNYRRREPSGTDEVHPDDQPGLDLIDRQELDGCRRPVPAGNQLGIEVRPSALGCTSSRFGDVVEQRRQRARSRLPAGRRRLRAELEQSGDLGKEGTEAVDVADCTPRAVPERRRRGTGPWSSADHRRWLDSSVDYLRKRHAARAQSTSMWNRRSAASSTTLSSLSPLPPARARHLLRPPSARRSRCPSRAVAPCSWPRVFRGALRYHLLELREECDRAVAARGSSPKQVRVPL